jgi:hypothetical protein
LVGIFPEHQLQSLESGNVIYFVPGIVMRPLLLHCQNLVLEMCVNFLAYDILVFHTKGGTPFEDVEENILT